ncbi:hypothetical protein UFOVP23_11 [uncultured Caudovirales phage]|uniref:Uncharacterized protein n=1 Tax=uncultured Caudovirales phage TaxID=2100421 RepID=A0A6J5T7M3_9CAUD|nr:hypothetical protein UFOVP23_11 [uncultured Caudovirales phage]
MTHVVATKEILDIIQSMRDNKELMSMLEKEDARLKMLLYKLMGETEEAITEDGELVCTWKYSNDTQYFDVKEFKEMSPDVYEMFAKTRPGARRLVIK